MSEPVEAPEHQREQSAPLRRRKAWVYALGYVACWILVRIWHRAVIRGQEHLPRAGGYLFAGNHQSSIDIPLLGVAAGRPVTFLYRESLRSSRFMAWFTDGAGAIPIHRGAPDRAALRAMRAHLAAGDCVVVFPEGTRSPDGRLGPFGGGILSAARRTGSPIVPAGIRGGFEAWPRGHLLPRLRRVSLDIGAPIDARQPDAPERLRASLLALVGDGRYRGGPAPEEPSLPSGGLER